MNIYNLWFLSFARLMTRQKNVYNFGMTNVLFTSSIILYMFSIINILLIVLKLSLNPYVGFSLILISFFVLIFLNNYIFSKKVFTTENKKTTALIILIGGYISFVVSLILYSKS
jgi:hypothetical protein